MCGGGSSSWNNKSTNSNRGGGGSDGGGGGGFAVEPGEDDVEDEEDRCIFIESTSLDSTNPDPLDDAAEGDTLPVEIQDGRPCVVDFDGRIIGSITGKFGQRLVECIETGYSYRARIVEISGRKCEVEVRNKCFIDERAMLASPNDHALDKVSEGDVLNVDVRSGGLCVVNDQDHRVGSLAKPWTGILIECIEEGREYQAEVSEIDGGACEVEVTNRPSEE